MRAAASSRARGSPSRRRQIRTTARALPPSSRERRLHLAGAVDEEAHRRVRRQALEGLLAGSGPARPGGAPGRRFRPRSAAARGWWPGCAPRGRRGAGFRPARRRRRAGARSCPAPAAGGARAAPRRGSAARGCPGTSRTPTAAATAWGTSAPSARGARSASQTPSRASGSGARRDRGRDVQGQAGLAAASRPGEGDQGGAASRRRTSAASVSRPTKAVRERGRLCGRGDGGSADSLTAGAGRSPPAGEGRGRRKRRSPPAPPAPPGHPAPRARAATRRPAG